MTTTSMDDQLAVFAGWFFYVFQMIVSYLIRILTHSKP